MDQKPLDCIGIPISRGQRITGKYDANIVLTEQEARERKYILDTNDYPHMVYTGQKVQKPGDWSREQLDVVLPVWTPLEATLRGYIKQAIRSLEERKLFISIIETSAIQLVIDKLTEALSRTPND